MVKLFCAIVGEESVITIDIDPQEAIGDLKEQIKTKAQYEFPSHKLVLYLAKKGGNKNKKGKWMKDDDGDLVRLQNATIPEDIEKKHLKKELLLKPTSLIKTRFTEVPKEKVIHVLVDTRGRDHVSVAVANENFSLLTDETEICGKKGVDVCEAMYIVSEMLQQTDLNACLPDLARTAIARWLSVFFNILYLISLVFIAIVFSYGESVGDKEKCLKDGVPPAVCTLGLISAYGHFLDQIVEKLPGLVYQCRKAFTNRKRRLRSASYQSSQ